ncbi:peptide chain release factor 1 [bacterium]|nr:peptide chain release factor 1 [bacterium]
MDIEKRCLEIEEAFERVERSLADPAVLSDQEKYREVTRRHSQLERIVRKWREFRKTRDAAVDAEALLDDLDPEMAEMARQEYDHAVEQLPALERDLTLLLLPSDPIDEKDIVMEIRAGTGGEEAALFAGDLFRMYSRYAEREGWTIELLSSNETELGGFKEIVFGVSGERVYSRLKFESGTHRVQRVPETEAQGRIHTSAITVAVMPEADEVDVEIRNEEIRIDVFRSSGPGGQSVNTTDSAVRVTHLPTGLVVSCQDEKSQHKNRAKALRVLRSRLYDLELQRRQDEESATRRAQVGTGDRSGRIRTYNFPQNRVTDHRIGLTLYKLEQVMDGAIGDLIEGLVQEEQSRKLAALGETAGA